MMGLYCLVDTDLSSPSNRRLSLCMCFDSVGFDIRGDIKIFDFGLAKEWVHLEPNDKGLYKMTGMSKSQN